MNASDRASGLQEVRIRRARPEDVEPILDLLTEYDLPRSGFEPLYYADPTYRPADSWLVEANEHLLAHLRVFPRNMYLQGVVVPVAGIGNVITAKAARGRGYAGRLLRTVLSGVGDEGYAYSLLWTHLSEMYGRFGWSTVPEPRVEAVMTTPIGRSAFEIRPFAETDFANLMQVYARINRGRAGAIERTLDYWRAQLGWLRLQPRDFLVASDTDGAIAAYARGALRKNGVELLEVGFADSQQTAAQRLLTELAKPARGRLTGSLPPCLLAAIPADPPTLTTSWALMGRTVDLQVLLRLLAPVWRARAANLDIPPTEVDLATAAGTLHITLDRGALRVDVLQASSSAGDERQFAHLLLRGFDELAPRSADSPSSSQLLHVLFPPQDFAIWGADSF